MDRVFVVTEGEYSGYGIVAVFSTKQKAEKFIDLQGGSEDESWHIEEYALDDYGQQMRNDLRFFEVTMDKEGASVVAAEGWYTIEDTAYLSLDMYRFENSSNHGVRVNLRPERGNKWGDKSFPLKRYGRENTGRALLVVKTFAKDKQHAVKIANEKRAQYIASGDWDEYETSLTEKTVQIG